MTERSELEARKLARIAAVHRLQRERTALLVVDMQKAFVEPGAALEVETAGRLVPNLKTLISVCRGLDVPVVFTQYVFSESVPCLRGDPFGPQHLPPVAGEATGYGRPSGNALMGTSGPNSPDIIDALHPREDELIVKGRAYDKFYGTELDQALRSRDIRYLIVTGVLADVCVNATILSASTREYRVTAVTDGTATLWPHILEACFHIWRRKFARLATTAEVVEELRTV